MLPWWNDLKQRNHAKYSACRTHYSSLKMHKSNDYASHFVHILFTDCFTILFPSLLPALLCRALPIAFDSKRVLKDICHTVHRLISSKVTWVPYTLNISTGKNLSISYWLSWWSYLWALCTFLFLILYTQSLSLHSPNMCLNIWRSSIITYWRTPWNFCSFLCIYTHWSPQLFSFITFRYYFSAYGFFSYTFQARYSEHLLCNRTRPFE